ncbi:hypothetical protein STVIR_1464 [Streptomyces viridochromogenes Tue57]|uniref:Uncharacterized protein n=1 Tax=Streptomyces viridochromogenes Tue57 TaxID=1160705 RepID=L8PNJ6_STRVR|nr:hypothetical protein STVIR_1464 [Streptomyces viridochromogenes Tue57]
MHGVPVLLPAQEGPLRPATVRQDAEEREDPPGDRLVRQAGQLDHLDGGRGAAHHKGVAGDRADIDHDDRPAVRRRAQILVRDGREEPLEAVQPACFGEQFVPLPAQLGPLPSHPLPREGRHQDGLGRLRRIGVRRQPAGVEALAHPAHAVRQRRGPFGEPGQVASCAQELVVDDRPALFEQFQRPLGRPGQDVAGGGRGGDPGPVGQMPLTGRSGQPVPGQLRQQEQRTVVSVGGQGEVAEFHAGPAPVGAALHTEPLGGVGHRVGPAPALDGLVQVGPVAGVLVAPPQQTAEAPPGPGLEDVVRTRRRHGLPGEGHGAVQRVPLPAVTGGQGPGQTAEERAVRMVGGGGGGHRPLGGLDRLLDVRAVSGLLEAEQEHAAEQGQELPETLVAARDRPRGLPLPLHGLVEDRRIEGVVVPLLQRVGEIPHGHGAVAVGGGGRLHVERPGQQAHRTVQVRLLEGAAVPEQIAPREALQGDRILRRGGHGLGSQPDRLLKVLGRVQPFVADPVRVGVLGEPAPPGAVGRSRRVQGLPAVGDRALQVREFTGAFVLPEQRPGQLRPRLRTLGLGRGGQQGAQQPEGGVEVRRVAQPVVTGAEPMGQRRREVEPVGVVGPGALHRLPGPVAGLLEVGEVVGVLVPEVQGERQMMEAARPGVAVDRCRVHRLAARRHGPLQIGPPAGALVARGQQGRQQHEAPRQFGVFLRGVRERRLPQPDRLVEVGGPAAELEAVEQRGGEVGQGQPGYVGPAQGQSHRHPVMAHGLVQGRGVRVPGADGPLVLPDQPERLLMGLVGTPAGLLHGLVERLRHVGGQQPGP